MPAPPSGHTTPSTALIGRASLLAGYPIAELQQDAPRTVPDGTFTRARLAYMTAASVRIELLPPYTAVRLHA